MKALGRMTLLPIFFALMVAGYVIYLAPQFREVFEAFDLQFPLPTRTLLAGYWGVLVSPVFAIAGCYFTKKGSPARAKIVIASFVITWVILSFTVWAMYLPVLASETSGGI